MERLPRQKIRLLRFARKDQIVNGRFQMNKENANPYPLPDRWSFLWLVIGSGLAIFLAGNWPLSLAGWLAPLFLIRFMRTQRKLWGFILISIGMTAASMVGYQGYAHPTQIPLLVFGAALGISYALLILVDRVLVARLPGHGLASFASTLVFPLLVTAEEFLLLNKFPYGSIGSWAYAQSSSLLLMQMISLTGLWGLTFLTMWFASTVNWAWERGFSWPTIRGGAAIYASCLLLVLVFGSLRLGFLMPPTGTVRVHMITAEGQNFDSMHYTIYPLLKKDRAAYRQLTTSTYAATLEAITREAQAGAQIIVLPETAVVGVQEDLDAFLGRVKQIAVHENVYVALGAWMADTNMQEVRLIVVDPSGEIVLNHLKYAYGMGLPLSQVELQTVDTPYGRLSGVMCGDLNIPGVVRQAGHKNVDILLVPGTEEPGTGVWHARMAAFRAVENGFSMVRSAVEGISLATDPYGRPLAAVDYFKANDRVMVVQVPTQGTQTVFGATGDWFGWLMVIGFVSLAGWAILRSIIGKKA
jgi:apolipoprotein N-acyltransferase